MREDITIRPDPVVARASVPEPVVWITKWEDLVTRGRRWVLASAGALGAGLLIAGAIWQGDWKTSLAAAGIVLDIAGAALLTSGLMLPAWATREMAIPRTRESKSVRTFWEQSAKDAEVAFCLLVAGFVGQGLALLVP